MELSLFGAFLQCHLTGKICRSFLRFNEFLQATSVMFVSVDTVSIDDDINDAESQKQLLDSELAKAGDDAWKIVFGHFPCHSGGGYSGITSTRQQILPIMRRHNVDFYLTGHDHNLQHWRRKGDFADVEHIVTGIDLFSFKSTSFNLCRSWREERIFEERRACREKRSNGDGTPLLHRSLWLLLLLYFKH